MKLHRNAVDAGVELVSLDTIDSTNAEALRRARTGAPAPLWITASSQSAGRGRQARNWSSPPGNLFASLLLIDPAPQARAPELSFVAALALHDAVSSHAEQLSTRLSFKWPNDLLLDSAKIAGILIEAERTAEDALAVVIGFGLNCGSHPQATPYPATDLAHCGFAVSAELAFDALTDAMLARLAQWDRGTGFASIRADWLARADGLGMPIRVRTGQRDVGGIFADIDAHGRIIVLLPDGGREAIGAGEVFAINGGIQTESIPV
jgi:BirA family biotin operon repressor/biotin-[acetyl-CoA-carboxylase] ligase